MRLQSARTVREYERNIETLKEMFPVGIPSGSGGKPTEEFVWTYLQEIYPTSWTVLGNSDLSDGETAWLKENWKDTSSYGFGLPLFGVRSTSGVEGDNNGLSFKRARNNLVFKALRAYCLRAVENHHALLEAAQSWVAEQFDITPHAQKLFDAEQKHVAKLTVLPSQIGCFYVFDPFDRSDVASATKMFETNMISGKCRPCRVSE
ncbi:hypothetical protein PInf_022165 [Phytophthora infestans]|nr:hypothetical protein PInf_022165 [Phytophthora infestans]